MATNNSANTYIVPTANNEVTQPSQPAFLAVLNGAWANATGDGTALSPMTIDLEIFDQNADFDTGTYQFTAPVTGVYEITNSVGISNAAGHTVWLLAVITSNRQYYSIYTDDVNNFLNTSNNTTYENGVFADMDAADTAHIYCRVNGGAKTVGISRGDLTDCTTHFSGVLVC